MTTFTKITGLNSLQVDALRQAVEVIPDSHGPGNVVLTKTTASFPWNAARTHTLLLEAKASLASQHGSRQHPVASIHAPIRKAARIASSQDAV